MRRESIIRLLCGLIIGLVLSITQNGLSTGAFTGSFSTSLAISGTTVSNLQANTATISWNTSDNASSQVFYDTVAHGDTSGYAFNSGTDFTPVLQHSVNLTGLQSSTVYHFRAVSTANVSGTLFTAITYDLTFEMATTDMLISIVLQGGRNDAGYEIPITVKFFSTLGGNVLSLSANYTSNTTTKRFGATTNATGNVTGIPPSIYDVTVVSDHTLLNVRRSANITSPSTTLGMGILLEGDVNGSGSVTILDFSAMIPSYLKSSGDSGFNPMADLDRSLTVNILDFSLAIPNYLKSSPIELPP